MFLVVVIRYVVMEGKGSIVDQRSDRIMQVPCFQPGPCSKYGQLSLVSSLEGICVYDIRGADREERRCVRKRG